ncbi:hypothetical protein Tco_0639812 [Tanacetum coccineum]
MNIQPPSEPSTPINVHAEENNDHQAKFTNPFCTPVQENARVFLTQYWYFKYAYLQSTSRFRIPMDKRSPVNSSSWKSIQASANKTTTCNRSEMFYGRTHHEKKFISLTDYKSGNSLTNLLARTNQAKVVISVSGISNEQDGSARSSAELNCGLSAKWCSSNVGWGHSIQDYASTQQNPFVLRLSVSHAISCKPREALCTKTSITRTEYQLADMFTKALPKERVSGSRQTDCSQVVNKSPTHYPCDSARTFRVILFSIHNDEWKSFQCHHQTALRYKSIKEMLAASSDAKYEQELVKDTRSQGGKDDQDGRIQLLKSIFRTEKTKLRQYKGLKIKGSKA